MRVIKDSNGVFKSNAKITMNWVGYYSPYTRLFFMDYNQNRTYDSTALKESFYMFDGTATLNEYYQNAEKLGADFKGEILCYQPESYGLYI